ncbi:MAG: hypothetical protein ACK4UN_06655 [Limisphaerales bacterium]
MNWKEKLDDPSRDFKLSPYAFKDAAELELRESHLMAADYQNLIANVFAPAIEQFRSELEGRGKLCETHKAKGSTSLVVRHLDSREIKITFQASKYEIQQTVLTRFLTGTWRFDTHGGQITIPDVLDCLADFYVSADPKR